MQARFLAYQKRKAKLECLQKQYQFHYLVSDVCLPLFDHPFFRPPALSNVVRYNDARIRRAVRFNHQLCQLLRDSAMTSHTLVIKLNLVSQVYFQKLFRMNLIFFIYLLRTHASDMPCVIHVSRWPKPAQLQDGFHFRPIPVFDRVLFL